MWDNKNSTLSARTRVPEHIVQQYQQYCCQTDFESRSRRTLYRSLFQAFDDLAKLPDKLASSRVSIQFGIGEGNSMGQLRRSYTITIWSSFPPSKRIRNAPTFRAVRHRHIKKAFLQCSTESLPGGNFIDREEGVLFPSLKKEAWQCTAILLTCRLTAIQEDIKWHCKKKLCT